MADNKNSKPGAKPEKLKKEAGKPDQHSKPPKETKSLKASKHPKASKPPKETKPPKKTKLSKLSGKLIGNNNLMLAVKAVVVGAAMLSLLMLIIVGADLRPSALLQGIRNKYAFTHASGDGFPVEFTGGKILGVSEVTKGTAVLTAARCTVYDGMGREVDVVNHGLSSPAMKSSGSYVLLFDSMGSDYKLRTLSGDICKGKTENSIICADVSRSGVFAFVTNSATNNARLVVYSSEGKVLHKWKSVNYKISDVALSPSGKYVAICGYSTKKGVLFSNVLIQQVGEHKNLREYSLDNTLIADIQFDGNACVAAVGDDLAAFFSVKDDKKSIYSYNGRTLNCYDLNHNGEMAFVFSDYSDGRNASVIVINDKCVEKANIRTSMTSPYVDLDNGRINLLFQSEVSCYNYKGKLLEQTDVSVDCQSLLTSGGKLLAKGVMTLKDIG